MKVVTTAANVNDITQTLNMSMTSIPSPTGPDARASARTLSLATKTTTAVRTGVSCGRGILPVISRKGSPDLHGLGKLRYVAEQTVALLHQFKHLAVRWERHLRPLRRPRLPRLQPHLLATPQRAPTMILLRALILIADLARVSSG
ncbi:hypothetical protein [Streptomyces aureoversilis]|uniref:Transposase n=1 Tax=Streptomyces aureoversilis TaxID=67277 RepID=A0ABW0AA57_9ACTN